jgi:hypothetical protein
LGPETPAPDRIRRGRRVALMTLLIAAIAAGLVWNLVFDMWLGQAERQYLLEDYAHELKLRPPVSLKATMAQATHDAFLVASGWSLFVAVAIAFAAWYAYRQGTRR